MKNILIVVSSLVLLSACGEDKTPVPPQAEPKPAEEVKVDPTAKSPLLGIWIDSSKNALVFRAKGKAISNGADMDWALDEKDRVVFSVNNTEVDTCEYQILSQGGLNKTLVVSLDLACYRAGRISYLSAKEIPAKETPSP